VLSTVLSDGRRVWRAAPSVRTALLAAAPSLLAGRPAEQRAGAELLRGVGDGGAWAPAVAGGYDLMLCVQMWGHWPNRPP
jgi:hypothetical protein